jgi:hypothetical protein
MSRNPFVWEVEVRREVLDDEMLRLRELPYTVWRHVVHSPIRKTVSARDNQSYRLRVAAEFVRGSEDIRVTMALARPSLLRRHTMTRTFVVTPDNEFKI